ncbi:hypothetical protein [Streptomyces sp. NPDC046197]|uniref:hypothetical protein n=1 Tax=Streptomyces sp. NPDC046197 TaxID=3154337 RepID=UPI0033C71157
MTTATAPESAGAIADPSSAQEALAAMATDLNTTYMNAPHLDKEQTGRESAVPARFRHPHHLSTPGYRCPADT